MSHVIKYGHGRGIQRYFCKECGKRFSSLRKEHKVFQKHLWEKYVFHKQTVEELSEIYQKDPRTIRGFLNKYNSPLKIHHSRPVNILVDATYFGERKEGLSWCVVVARDARLHEDLVWLFSDTETTLTYTILKEELEKLGYTILSVTGDGFPGIKTAFFGIPYQMCHVHMERLVTIRTTRNPQTEAGQVLLALGRSIHNTNSHLFITRLNQYIEKYRDALNEKTFNEISGRWDWTHRSLRQATLSLERLKKYLFTYEHNKDISKTTNSLEGHFSHMKQYLGVHRGVPKKRAEKILNSLLLGSTVSPKRNVLRKIL